MSSYDLQRTRCLNEAADLRHRAEHGRAAKCRPGAKASLLEEAERLERMAETLRTTGKWAKELYGNPAH